MQPDPEADELQALLQEEYGAPRLDEQFSADLVARLQAEASPLPSPPLMPSLTPARPRRSLLAISLGSAAVAASIIAIIWIANSGTPGTNREVARRAEIDSNGSAHPELRPLATESEHERLEHLSVPRSLTLSESLSARNESESKNNSESRLQSRESLPTEERPATTLSRTTTLSVLSSHLQEWPNISAAVALADMLYVVDSGQLYEVGPSDGSRRSVGEADWRNTAAMGAAGGHLYLVCDNQLYEVNPKTGARRSVGKPDWANTKAIVTAGDKLYIASNGLLHRLNPSDGSHEVLHSKNDRPNNPRQPKP